MISIRALVQKELMSQPELLYWLQKDLINITGLARHLRPSIQTQLGEVVGVDTIGMAIRRLQKESLGSASRMIHTPKAKNIHIQLDVTILTYGEGAPLDAMMSSAQCRFFSFAKGRVESMLAISQEDVASLSKTASRIQNDMAALTITLDEESSETVGAYMYIQLLLTVANIPLAEVVSLHDDLTLLIADAHVDRAFQILRDALKG